MRKPPAAAPRPAAPSGAARAAAPAAGVGVDRDQQAVALAGPLVGTSAPLGQGDVGIFGNQATAGDARLVELLSHARNDVAVELPFEQLAPVGPHGRSFARRVAAVAVVE